MPADNLESLDAMLRRVADLARSDQVAKLHSLVHARLRESDDPVLREIAHAVDEGHTTLREAAFSHAYHEHLAPGVERAVDRFLTLSETEREQLISSVTLESIFQQAESQAET